MHLEVEPRDFDAEMSLEVTLDRPDKVEELSYEKTLADVPVPGAGVVIKDVLSVGLRIQLTAGLTTQLRSGITFRAGLKASLPGTAKITMDVLNFWESSASGFGGFTVDPTVKIISLPRSAEIALAAKPKLVFGVDIIGMSTYEIAAIFNLPELKATCTAKYSTYSDGRSSNAPS